MELSKDFTFEASHILPKHSGKCSRLHGHSWRLKVSVIGDIDPKTGFVMDYTDLKKTVQPIVDALDHRHLGTFDAELWDYKECMREWGVEGLNIYPSSENLAFWIASQLWPLDQYLINHHDTRSLRPSEVIELESDIQTKVEPVVLWSKIELNETCTSACILTRENFACGL